MKNRTGIPDQLKTGIEKLSGCSMDQVRVHYDSAKPAQLNALAFTQGNEVHLAPGHKKLLAHELTHVVQQKQGRVQPVNALKGIGSTEKIVQVSMAGKKDAQFTRYNEKEKVTIVNDAKLEREADRMAAKISK